MYFIYDAAKNQSNASKHGISLEEARGLWQDEHLVEVAARHRAEKRRLVIAKRDGAYWSAIITYRGSAIRIISARRSTEKEKRLYDKNRQHNYRR